MPELQCALPPRHLAQEAARHSAACYFTVDALLQPLASEPSSSNIFFSGGLRLAPRACRGARRAKPNSAVGTAPSG
jgi:hypothetical protein